MMQFFIKGYCSPRSPSELLEEDPGQEERDGWPVIHCLFLFFPTLTPPITPVIEVTQLFQKEGRGPVPG